MTKSLPLVSCLCVTRGRVAMLKRVVACFRSQTWARERDRVTSDGKIMQLRLAILLMLSLSFSICVRADSRAATKDVMLFLSSPLGPIEGGNARAVETISVFLEQRRCSELAAGSVVVDAVGFAAVGSSDSEESAARVRSHTVGAYLTSHLPGYVRIHASGPITPFKQNNRWDEFASRTALPGAVMISVRCTGAS